MKPLLKRSKHNNSIQSKHKSLSIQFSLDGFSFCVVDIATKKVISFITYSFNVATPELLLDKIQQIFTKEKTLQQEFDEIKVVHQNNLSTVVPDAFFNKNKLKTYLDYTIKTLTNDYVDFDDITSIKAKNVYIPFVNINNYLFQNFGEFEFNHHSTILINKLIEYSKNNKEAQFFVNVSVNNIDVVVTKGEKLILYNNFFYHTKEDFIYYILFVAEQLELQLNEFQLTFLGDIKENDALYKITYQYIQFIDFIQPSSDFFVNSDDFTTHSNYILIS